MNIGQLIYFIEIVTSEFNISDAAERMHVSQSTMSKSILKFEKDEKVTLFIRRGKRLVGLTEKGKRFYHDAKRVIKDYDSMISNVQKEHKITGTVRVGIAPAVFVSYFSSILPKFKLDNPNIKVDVFELGGEELQQKLLLEKIDLAYMVAPIKFDSLQNSSLIKDYGAAVFNPEFFDFQDSLSISELAELPLVLLDNSFTIRDQLNTLFEYDNLTPNLLMSSKSENFLLNAVRSNKVVTVLPRAVLRGYRSDGLKVIPLKQLTWELFSSVYKKSDDLLTTKTRNIFDKQITKLNSYGI